MKIFIYDNIYGLAWGGILSFPRKGLFMRGGIVKQGAHIYKLETYIHTYIYIDIYIYICTYTDASMPKKKGNI